LAAASEDESFEVGRRDHVLASVLRDLTQQQSVSFTLVKEGWGAATYMKRPLVEYAMLRVAPEPKRVGQGDANLLLFLLVLELVFTCVYKNGSPDGKRH